MTYFTNMLEFDGFRNDTNTNRNTYIIVDNTIAPV